MTRERILDVIVGFTNFLLGAIMAFLGLRFILRFFGADATNAFVEWVYETSQPLLAPFVGIFPVPVLEGQFVVEFSTLFAMLIYSILGLLLLGFLESLARPTARSKR